MAVSAKGDSIWIFLEHAGRLAALPAASFAEDSVLENAVLHKEKRLLRIKALFRHEVGKPRYRVAVVGLLCVQRMVRKDELESAALLHLYRRPVLVEAFLPEPRRIVAVGNDLVQLAGNGAGAFGPFPVGLVHVAAHVMVAVYE